MKPNLFVVGAPKCGTSSLHAYLAQHPDIFMAGVKEPHVFSPDLVGSNYYGVQSMSQYDELFDGVSCQVAGEASVWYLYSDEAPALIEQYSPGARIIIAVRDPLKMIPSLHRQFLRSLNEDQYSLDAAIACQSDRAQGRMIPAESHFAFGLQYEEIAKYDVGIERYYQRFGNDRVHVVCAEDLGTSTETEMLQILTFLGLEPAELDLTQLNRSDDKTVYPEPLRKLLKKYPQLASVLQKASPSSARRVVRNLVAAKGITEQQMWSDEVRAEVAARLSPHVERTRQLTGLELQGWLSIDGAQ